LPGKWNEQQIPHPPGKTAGFGMTVWYLGSTFLPNIKTDEMDMALGMEPGCKQRELQEMGLLRMKAARNDGGGVLRVDANLCEVMR
jgi:hypothetical protein